MPNDFPGSAQAPSVPAAVCTSNVYRPGGGVALVEIDADLLERLGELRHTQGKREDVRDADQVVDAMTTNETFFFRDKIPFEQFRSVIMPALLKARSAQRSIRIWCAAC